MKACSSSPTLNGKGRLEDHEAHALKTKWIGKNRQMMLLRGDARYVNKEDIQKERVH
jgi:hypothetical protein